jgi:Na+/H+-dicarboxylate symporter
MTVGVFGGLVVLFLHRSVGEHEPTDSILHYMPPAVGCAVANYVGNQGQGPMSALIVVAVLAYIVLVLKPFGGLKF